MDNIRCNIKKSIDEIIKINIKLANLYSGLSINNNVIKFKNIPIISEGLKNSKTNLQELASVEYVNQIAGGLDRTETLELTGSPISLTTTGAIQINNNDQKRQSIRHISLDSCREFPSLSLIDLFEEIVPSPSILLGTE